MQSNILVVFLIIRKHVCDATAVVLVLCTYIYIGTAQSRLGLAFDFCTKVDHPVIPFTFLYFQIMGQWHNINEHILREKHDAKSTR